MENKEVPIKPSVKVTLKPMTELLSEVLVTGTYGSAKKLGSMVGSVAAVKSEKIANRPSANFADALQGQVAGLQVFTSSGESVVAGLGRGVAASRISTFPPRCPLPSLRSVSAAAPRHPASGCARLAHSRQRGGTFRAYVLHRQNVTRP